MCVWLAERSRTSSPRGERSTAQSKPASICSPLRHVRCVSASLCVSAPAAIHFLEVSVTVHEVCVRVRMCDCLDVCACMCVPPSSDIWPLAHRNPSSKGRECSKCLDRQNMSPTSEASSRVCVCEVALTLVGFEAGDLLGS